MGCRRKGAPGTLASGTETTEGTRVRRYVLLVFVFELLDEQVDETIIETLPSEMGITSRGLENTFVDSQKGDIESFTSKIENKNVTFPTDFLVEAIGDSGSGRFVDNSKDIETGDGPSIRCESLK